MQLALFAWFVSIWALVAASVTPFDSPDFCSQIITPTCNTTFSYIDQMNAHLRPVLQKLIQTPFFRHFKLDLDKQCKFWNAQHFCATRNCAVEVLDKFNWSEVSEELSPAQLGSIQREPAGNDVAETCEDLDYCHIDEGNNCVFVDLVENPERFTGYGGVQSFDVWKAIYSENCFPNTSPMSSDGEREQCVEKNLFYRVISGLHASIAVHLSNEYLDSTTGEFKPNLQVFMDRVGKFGDRLSNIYFNYALVSQAIVRLSELVSVPSYIENNAKADSDQLVINSHVNVRQYGEMLGEITSELAQETLFDAHRLFDPQTVDPELKNEFRSRFRNVSAIMDCVGCDRCRMWGKLQTIGYGTALKILFDSEDPDIQHLVKFRRIELVALFNTFDRLSKSVASINNFKQMYLRHLQDVAEGRAQMGDYEPLHDRGLEFPFMAFQPKEKKTEAENELPEKVVAEDGILTHSTQQQTFWDELENVKEALHFIWNSYVQFPKTIYDLTLYYVSGFWDVYVGKAVYVPSGKTQLDDEL
ncbi:putative endoplasmic reticulum oxidoreductin protein [Clavispora lusitaniae]|uniref:Endoplasmic reticulum oxidoreductin protein n=1 Tax=Clavispora lusitaniae TaxID=36911 RepID=A0ACD0WQW7_CLALS|nr:putative endoplasmic reticulum oxidoreductin protein [Clavispora lusitaniae]QFZ35419.1 putative endoplasmic reticulum oxidoreductin protein [Clavispora lusitaniae]QFZ41113.1 putative endoplasmic reticulum oxidoreductin protein [Clavispora lusitaniae]QFZ46794.1 putative endoplasmic reticulum oxidoreductin protein [Clavispora lusitaniae]QFZ52459.1 putative endoplasmic reticulum oxidoreductin protein [Clavispora lusitaniae]